MRRVVVVGGGIAGLATALQLADRGKALPGGLDVRLLEAAPRLGGNIRTEHAEGFTVEWGPNGFLDNVPAMARLVERVGLAPAVRRADDAAGKRYLFRHGRLHELPAGPGGFLASPVLSLRGRLRVLLEPFAATRPEGVDESIHEFAARRIGAEAAEVLVDAMVSGVFAGDTKRLSLASAFPKMAAMEAEHGSLVRAMLARMRERRAAKRRARELAARGEEAAELTRPGGPAGPGGTLTSFEGGLEHLIDALAAALGDAVRTGAPVAEVAPVVASESGTRRWRVIEEAGESIDADAVVLAVPAARAAGLVRAADAGLAGELEAIRTAGLAVVALGYEAASLQRVPAGFGFLIPRSEGVRSLGCLWDSSIFPGRAPADRVLLRVMIGGAHDPGAVDLDDGALLATVRADLARTMALDAEPCFVRIYRHPRGIAQYEPGHQARLAGIEDRLRRLGGLRLAGSSYRGVSMNSCVEDAERQAAEIVEDLGAPGDSRSVSAGQLTGGSRSSSSTSARR